MMKPYGVKSQVFKPAVVQKAAAGFSLPFPKLLLLPQIF